MQLLAVAGLEKTSSTFQRALVAMASRLGLDPSYLAAVMSIESARSFSPSIQNPYSGATGLIQFMPATAQRMGTSTAELAQMTAIEQLAWVEEFFRPHVGRIRPDVPGDYYLSVFYPSAVGTPSDHVIAREGDPVYDQNHGLDANHDGILTSGDTWAVIDGVVAAARSRPPITVSSSLIWPWMLAGGITVGVWLKFQHPRG